MSNSVNIRLDVARSIASLISVADSGKNAMPLLSQVVVTIAGGVFKARATDRFALVELTGPYGDETVEAELRITPKIAKFLLTAKAREFSAIDVEFTVDDESRTITAAIDGGAREVDTYAIGNYPSIGKFVADWQIAEKAAPIGLSLPRLAAFTKIIDLSGEKITDWIVEPSEAAITEFRPTARPGALRLTPLKGALGFTGLLQPMNIPN